MLIEGVGVLGDGQPGVVLRGNAEELAHAETLIGLEVTLSAASQAVAVTDDFPAALARLRQELLVVLALLGGAG